MVKLVRTNSESADFIHLVKELDDYLKITDGDEHTFYNQFNNIDVIKNTIVAYFEEKPIGCGAFKKFDQDCVEIKRMFTKPEFRDKGIASKILKELENWAMELNYSYCILETGTRQTEAVRFYHKSGYSVITNYGQYKNIANSICFKKTLLNEKR